MDYKFLNLRFRMPDMETASALYTNFDEAYPDVGPVSMSVYHEEATGAVLAIIQLSNEGTMPEWQNSLRAVLEIVRPNSTALMEMGFDYDQVEYLDLTAMGEGLTPEEKMMFEFIGGLTGELKLAIMPILTEYTVLEAKVASQEEIIKAVKVHSLNNSQHITHIMNAIRSLGMKLGFEDDDEIFDELTVQIQ